MSSKYSNAYLYIDLKRKEVFVYNRIGMCSLFLAKIGDFLYVEKNRKIWKFGTVFQWFSISHIRKLYNNQVVATIFYSSLGKVSSQVDFCESKPYLMWEKEKKKSRRPLPIMEWLNDYGTFLIFIYLFVSSWVAVTNECWFVKGPLGFWQTIIMMMKVWSLINDVRQYETILLAYLKNLHGRAKGRNWPATLLVNRTTVKVYKT